MIVRKFATIGLLGIAAVLGLAAVTWACTPSAYLYPVSPAAGAAGTEVTIRGGQFGNGPVEIRWGSEKGRLLGTTLGPEFTTRVSIPDRDDGVHYLVAVARDPADPSRMLARRVEAFQIKSNAQTEARRAASLWSQDQPEADEDRSLMVAIAATGIGLVLSAGAFALFSAVSSRRKRFSAK